MARAVLGERRFVRARGVRVGAPACARRGLATLRVLAALCALLALAGCETREVELLVIESAAPDVIEPGTRLQLTGRGMPAGLRGEARLRGTLSRPGALPSDVQVRVPVVPDSASSVAVPAEALLSRLGGVGSFEGSVQLAFAARGGAAELTGSHALAFDLLDPMALGVAGQHALREAGAQLLDRAGIVPRDDVSTHDGIEIAHVRTESFAEVLGLRAGDVIERASSVRVHALGDLAPPPLSTAVEWTLRREGHAHALSVRMPVKLEHAPTRLPIDRLAWLLAWAVSAALLLVPRTPLWVRVVRVRARLRAAGGSALGVWGAPRPTAAAPASRVRRLAPLSISVAGALLVCFEPASLLSVRSLSLYLPLVAVGVALALMQDGVPRRQRLRQAARQLGRMSVMGVVLACACALSGTRALDGIVATQGAWPWQWGALHNPALLAALPLYVVSAAQIGEPTAAAAAQRAGLFGQLVLGEQVLSNVVLCALAAAIFFGGWQSPELLQLGPWPERWAGALLFVGKSWAFAYVLMRVRQIRLGYAQPARLWLLWSLSLLAVTTAYVLVPPPSVLTVLHGRAAAATLLVLVVVVFLQSRGREPLATSPPIAAVR